MGEQGRDGVYEFYSTKFLAQLPGDLMPVTVSQTIAENTIVEEAVYAFTQ